MKNKVSCCVTAGSCFFERSAENQGLWEFEEEILYRVYTNFLIWGCDMVEENNIVKYSQ